MRKWYIWDEMRRMQEQMDRMFDNFSRNEPTSLTGMDNFIMDPRGMNVIRSNYRQPLADMRDDGKELVVSVELPGVDKKDINLNVSDNRVEIKVEKKTEFKQKDENKGMYRMERSYKGFYRCFSLPENVDPNKIDASFENGLLKLRMPKKIVEKKKRKRIEIR